MGTAHGHMIAPPEYEEEPTKDQVHHRHKVLNEIKEKKRKLSIDTTNTEPDIKKPSSSPENYNTYKRKKLNRDAPIFFAK